MAQSMRLRSYYALTRGLFAAGFGLAGLRRDVIRGNLERSFPELDRAQRREIEREFVRRQSELAAEVLYAFSMSADELRERVHFLNPEILMSAAPPRPLIMAAAHYSNFEWLFLRASLDLGDRLLGLYKPMSNQRANAAFLRMRTRFGARMVPAKSIIRELSKFREAAVLGFLADQVPKSSPEKHWTQFLHQDTAFYMGPELLARALRSRVVAMNMRRLERGRYEVVLEPLTEMGERLPTGETTERYVRALEGWIHADPANWWWAHKRWKIKREVPVQP
jgi:KDO2-lipid IV(A) lauroyltransferase